MEINKNGHLSFNAVAYRQLDPDGGASDTLDREEPALDKGRRCEREPLDHGLLKLNIKIKTIG